MAIEDFLELEGLLTARLDGQISGIKKVYGAAELSAVTQDKQVTPSIAVIYKTYTVHRVNARKCGARIKQQWFTVLSVRNVSDQKHGTGIRNIAGPMIIQIKDLLLGWKPSDEFTALEIIPGAKAGTAKGVGHFPIGWATEVNL